MPVFVNAIVTTASLHSAIQQATLFAEEEYMTHYTRDDLDDDWEFKIVRSITPVFRNRAVLRKLREEEARAGWIMVEKFDDNRVRFKRRRSASALDKNLPAGVDPYRTQYGISPSEYAALIVAAIMGALLLAGVIMAIIVFITATPPIR